MECVIPPVLPVYRGIWSSKFGAELTINFYGNYAWLLTRHLEFYQFNIFPYFVGMIIVSRVPSQASRRAGMGASVARSPAQSKPGLDRRISEKSGAAAACVSPEVWGRESEWWPKYMQQRHQCWKWEDF